MRIRLISLLMPLAAASLSAAEPVKFNRDVRPVLNSQCFKCHGGVKEAGGLNLQFRDLALKAGDSGEAAIIPGKPEESLFFKRLVTHVETERMPKKEPPLSAAHIDLLKRWIAEGAKWEDHWAYMPPQGSNQSIDEIVSEALEGQQLTLSAPADVRTLARRMALDITGLPPSLEKVEFLVNTSEADRRHVLAAYVDELLASPAYGERWAAPWLDLSRYADSKGYEADGLRDMWRYRDWLIDALNADMPYDRFLTEQLAGDLLPNASDEQIIATAFHRNTPQNDEGGTDDEEFRTYAVLDRLNSTFDALQGTSMSCVQCHGHPYDPFVHREYYELMAFFNNTADADRNDQAPTRKFYSRQDGPQALALKKEVDELKQKIESMAAGLEAKSAFENWVTEQQGGKPGSALGHVSVESTAGIFEVVAENRVLLASAPPAATTITVRGSPDIAQIASLALEVLPDTRLPQQGPGGHGNGNFIISRVHASVIHAGTETPLEIVDARATHEQDGWPVREALKTGENLAGEGESGWAIGGGTGKAQIATFILARPVPIPAGAQIRMVIECENQRWIHHILGSFRVLASETVQAVGTAKGFLARPIASWTPAERLKVQRQFFSGHDPTARTLYETLDRQQAALAKIPECNLPIMQELKGKEARETKLFHRGNWLDKTEVVQPKTPLILNVWKPEYAPNRLGFAQWLTNGENPLTARVQVNRVWEQLFGIGLVETLEDFGSQGDKPRYQGLLDTLALRFQNKNGWSQKALIREIVLSRVYQQSSKATPEQMEHDPANRLLARGPRFRLTHEQVRDQALTISGTLDLKMGGRPVMPYQPPGVWLTPYNGADWKTATDGDARRRAVYTFIRRSATYPTMLTFDAPNREFCVVRRVRTNTPLQSLDLLNSPVFMEAAAGLVSRMTGPGGTLEEQLARGLTLATLRPARAEEVQILKELHQRVNGNMTLVANAILNLDEVLSKN